MSPSQVLGLECPVGPPAGGERGLCWGDPGIGPASWPPHSGMGSASEAVGGSGLPWRLGGQGLSPRGAVSRAPGACWEDTSDLRLEGQPASPGLLPSGLRTSVAWPPSLADQPVTCLVPSQLADHLGSSCQRSARMAAGSAQPHRLGCPLSSPSDQVTRYMPCPPSTLRPVLSEEVASPPLCPRLLTEAHSLSKACGFLQTGYQGHWRCWHCGNLGRDYARPGQAPHTGSLTSSKSVL